MNINQIKAAAEIAKTRTNDRRWLAAIDKAVAGVESGWWVITELADSLAITTETGHTYFANGVCQCKAFENGQACKHRALYRLAEIANEETAPEAVSAPIRAYHGTDADFDEFDFTLGEPHFTLSREAAEQFAKGRHGKQRRVVEADLDIQKPAGLAEWTAALERATGGNPRGMAVRDLRAQGYDAVVTDYEIIPFSPEQVRIVKPPAPRITRSIERDRTGVSVKVVRCDGWTI